MNARVAKEEMALLLPASLNFSPAADDGLRLSEAAHDASGSKPGLFRRLAHAFAEFRQRRAVLAELSLLSDRELADIGLSRPELNQVFDPDFAAAREADRAISLAHG
jgi:uncharacterized protein YjiS (DUF1127 family)